MGAYVRRSSGGAGANDSLGIGSKGDGRSVEDARAATNPHFGDANARADGWRHNCQSCSVTQEALVRGYDVEAVPHPPGTPYFAGSDGTQHKWYDAFTGGNSTFHTRDGYYWEGKETSSLLHTERQVQREVVSWGDGARGVVCVRWKGGRSSHILNVVNTHGLPYFSDGQDGKFYTLNSILDMASPKTGFLVTRIDNLDFTPNVRYLTKGK